ncbi:MAG: ATP-binding protein [Oscillospiraceae bacterium]|nr:ATP-binding protein [Oscillospiraceae bacterium]
MKELSLNILDIAMNSVKANSKNIEITLDEDDDKLVFTITDDGCGMSEDTVKKVTSPFVTSRTTRKVGMGIPFLVLAAEQTGGSVKITSQPGKGTTVRAEFIKHNIDYTPLGDITSTIITLINGSPDIDFIFRHNMTDRVIFFSTKDIRKVLGDVPLSNAEVITFLKEYLSDQYEGNPG